MAFVEEQSREKTTIIQKYLSKITCNKKEKKKGECHSLLDTIQ